jgi:acyl CoA:acetate/3-ketoacid CoA transferase alpha subunit/acyl CoA:acetate/3-ketoacid CoA transferase beta subunit
MPLLMPLKAALAAHVRPGQHLHFASTPSRSNAAIRELARAYQGTRPDFLLSSSGFHSTAHLLVRLGLGRAYLACFFGDNYPVPRPNPLYQSKDVSQRLIVYSLLSYVEAFRAGAMGNPHAVIRSLAGTDLGRDLAKSGAFTELDAGSEKLGLVRALRSDLTFVHGLLGDEQGNVVFGAPYGEGFFSANGAKSGVIATVEKVVPTEVLRDFKDSMPIARHRVLAVCEEPQGAHPQPLIASARHGVADYPDDFAHYCAWRKLASDDAWFARFRALVLDADDGREGYARFRRSLEQGELPKDSASARPEFASEGEAGLVLAARAIADKVKAGNYRLIIAGIGHSFLASRLAKTWLERQGVDVEVIVETGLVGLDCGPKGDGFLLSHRTISGAKRHSDVADALGSLACGADGRCLGVIGAGEIDPTGAINSSWLPSGKFLVGPGGANDIASAAAEVIALTRSGPGRMVPKVSYITSPGHRVTEVVSDQCTFRRASPGEPWTLSRVYPAMGGRPLRETLAEIRRQCPWAYSEEQVRGYEPPISTREKLDVHHFHPDGELWTRER